MPSRGRQSLDYGHVRRGGRRRRRTAAYQPRRRSLCYLAESSSSSSGQREFFLDQSPEIMARRSLDAAETAEVLTGGGGGGFPAAGPQRIESSYASCAAWDRGSPTSSVSSPVEWPREIRRVEGNPSFVTPDEGSCIMSGICDMKQLRRHEQTMEAKETKKPINPIATKLQSSSFNPSIETRNTQVRRTNTTLLSAIDTVSRGGGEQRRRRLDGIVEDCGEMKKKKNAAHEHLSPSASGCSVSDKICSAVATSGSRRSMEVISEAKAKLIAWKEAQTMKLMNKLSKKAAVIEEWEKAETLKAKMEMEKAEADMDGKREKAVRKMEKKIQIAQRKADEKRLKAEAETSRKISKVVNSVDKLKVPPLLICL